MHHPQYTYMYKYMYVHTGCCLDRYATLPPPLNIFGWSRFLHQATAMLLFFFCSFHLALPHKSAMKKKTELNALHVCVSVFVFCIQTHIYTYARNYLNNYSVTNCRTYICARMLFNRFKIHWKCKCIAQ